MSDQTLLTTVAIASAGLTMALGAIGAAWGESRIAAAAMDALASTETRYELELKDLTGPGIEARYAVATVPLVIPRQIDLQAAVSI